MISLKDLLSPARPSVTAEYLRDMICVNLALVEGRDRVKKAHASRDSVGLKVNCSDYRITGCICM